MRRAWTRRANQVAAAAARSRSARTPRIRSGRGIERALLGAQLPRRPLSVPPAGPPEAVGPPLESLPPEEVGPPEVGPPPEPAPGPFPRSWRIAARSARWMSSVALE